MLRPDTTSILNSPITANRSAVNSQNYPNTIPSCDEAAVVTPVENVVPLHTRVYTLKKLQAYPNPLQKRFSIEFPKNYRGNFTMQIVSVFGTTYQLGKTSLNGGGTAIDLDISKLSLRAGLYFLKVTSENKNTEIIKLIVE